MSIFQEPPGSSSSDIKRASVLEKEKRLNSYIGGFLTENGANNPLETRASRINGSLLFGWFYYSAAGFARPILFSTCHWLATVILPIALIWNSTISMHRWSWWLYRNQESGTTGCWSVLYVSCAVGRRVCRTKCSKSGALPRIIWPWPRIKIRLYFLGLA